jgi:hypothetical protein
MWEALNDSAAGITMIQTAENLAKKYGITRAQVDEFASQLVCQGRGRATSRLSRRRNRAGGQREVRAGGLQATRGIKLQGKAHLKSRRTRMPACRPVEVLAKLSSGVPGRRADRRQQFGAGRCRRGRSRGLGRLCPSLEGKKPLARAGGRSRGGGGAGDHGYRPGPRHPACCWSARACGWTTSAASRSTRPRARRPWPWAVNWASTSTRSTSTAAPLRSATRWRRPACASRSRWPVNCKRAGLRYGVSQRLHRRRPGHRPADREPGRSLNRSAALISSPNWPDPSVERS